MKEIKKITLKGEPSRLDGSRPNISAIIPKPFTDENGDFWIYDLDMGWVNTRVWKETMKKLSENILNLGNVKGKIMLLGTGGDIDNKGHLEKMFFNPEQYNIVTPDWNDEPIRMFIPAKFNNDESKPTT